MRILEVPEKETGGDTDISAFFFFLGGVVFGATPFIYDMKFDMMRRSPTTFPQKML